MEESETVSKHKTAEIHSSKNNSSCLKRSVNNECRIHFESLLYLRANQQVTSKKRLELRRPLVLLEEGQPTNKEKKAKFE
jgi:hypothetical protein